MRISASTGRRSAATVLAAFPFALCLGVADIGNAAAATLYEQRQLYRQAVDHVRTGRITAARKIQEQLDGYPLQPYITYHELRLRLSRLTPDQVNRFRHAHPDIPGAHRIYRQWLVKLAAGRQWQAFLDNYEPASPGEPLATELRCLYLRALYNTGQRELALNGVAPVWTAGQSQPKACDPIFQVWQSSGLDQETAWRRLRLAIEANERQLARYLQRFFTGDHKPWAQSYYNVHVNPASVRRTSRFRTDTPLSREVIAHGLRRLAPRDAEAARDAWASYRTTHRFSEAARRALTARIDVELARTGLLDDARTSDIVASTAADFAEAYLHRRNWALLSAWIERLPDTQRFEEKWQYWLARALTNTHEANDRARLAYQALAGKRSYYGFLAADRIGQAPQLNFKHRPDAGGFDKVRQLPAIARATELFAVGDEVNAQREWMAMLPRLTPEEQSMAAYLAKDLGRLILAIRTANETGQRNHLDVRFPIDHTPTFQQTSHATGIPLAMLVAFARQESIFNRFATSTADARGVMQMLHSTARHAARRAGMPTPSVTDLYDPTVNIPLGGNHIAFLLRRYDQSLPLAAAAYNAGETRVAKWLRDAEGWPMDVWIETIPFKETRNYVKNVLSFNQVYSQMLGQPQPMLRAHEAFVPPR